MTASNQATCCQDIFLARGWLQDQVTTNVAGNMNGAHSNGNISPTLIGACNLQYRIGSIFPGGNILGTSPFNLFTRKHFLRFSSTDHIIIFIGKNFYKFFKTVKLATLKYTLV